MELEIPPWHFFFPSGARLTYNRGAEERAFFQ